MNGPRNKNGKNITHTVSRTLMLLAVILIAGGILLSCGKGDEPTPTPTPTEAPTITVLVSNYNVDIFGGSTLTISDTKLLLDGEEVASWTDKNTATCKVTVQCNGKDVASGAKLSEQGKLVITVTNENGKSTQATVTLTSDTIMGLQSITLKVDSETDLLGGVTFGSGVTLVKVAIEMDGSITDITNPNKFAPQYPGTCNLIYTLKGKNGKTGEVKIEKTIMPLDYNTIAISNIAPVNILPIIGQVESGDKQSYSHIEHLRIAEATRIRDMMWKYGAGSHTTAQYQQLMSRLNTGMIMEQPLGYDNYNIIGGETNTEKTSHAHNQWHILNSLIKHANFKTVSHKYNTWQANLLEFTRNNPNSINVFWCSAYMGAYNKSEYDRWLFEEDIIELCNQKNFTIFAAGTNIESHNGTIINQIYNGEYTADIHGYYSLASLSNSDRNTQPNSHLFVTIATEADGDIDQTNETVTSTKVPRHINPESLFSGRAFPYKDYKSGRIVAEGNGINKGKYSTSYTGPLNACMADLCFQMYAEVADVDQLLDMIRSTSLTDYIRFNGETQPLQLMNPGGFFKKYCMPGELSSNVSLGETVTLEKGYYKGVIFDFPGAEVLIDGKWIAYDNKNKNKDIIMSKNPFALQWRMNGDLLRKLGYKTGDTLSGRVITVDDQWNDLNLSVYSSLAL